MDGLDLGHFLAQELWYQQLVNLEGLHSGVPTRTTPTLTPTTLRNIEQTFIELQCDTEPHQNEAGFVPPLVQPLPSGGTNGSFMSMVDSKAWQGGGITSISTPQTRASVLTCLPGPSPPMTTTAPPTSTTAPSAPATSTRRNVGGRRPNKNTGISPEEEERRRVRRERNKMAAARCRKRRMDHTNALLQETEGLEQKKQSLQTEIQTLQSQKEELEFLLEAHKAAPGCRLRTPASPVDIKPLTRVRIADTNDLAATTAAKRPRPSTLAVPPAFAVPKSALVPGETVAGGVPISTPSSGLPFNFESLMEGGTGLTPVSGPLVPSCSSQQRNTVAGCVDLSSPDAVPPKLVSL